MFGPEEIEENLSPYVHKVILDPKRTDFTFSLFD
jgi:hypothetical protein